LFFRENSHSKTILFLRSIYQTEPARLLDIMSPRATFHSISEIGRGVKLGTSDHPPGAAAGGPGRNDDNTQKSVDSFSLTPKIRDRCEPILQPTQDAQA
jgi:hypothetical protein